MLSLIHISAGTYAIRLGSLSAGPNYTLNFVGADFTIGKAPLAVTADAKSKTYGDADPVLTYTATGFVNGDDNTIVTGSLGRATGENVGDYAIAQNTLSCLLYTSVFHSLFVKPLRGEVILTRIFRRTGILSESITIFWDPIIFITWQMTH